VVNGVTVARHKSGTAGDDTDAVTTERVAAVIGDSPVGSGCGHASILLEWRLSGTIEAVDGLILFGLATEFLYAAIHKAWPLRRD
jgi:hypothetical protein